MAMVEMVFVLPVLLILLFAIARFGLMFHQWMTLSSAVREGARDGSYYRDPNTCNPNKVELHAIHVVKNYVSAIGIDPMAVNVSATGGCTGSGTQFTVSATIQFDPKIPFASATIIPLSYSSTMRNE